MQSAYGRRGAICKHFGWTWWELNHNIPWVTLHKIMVDLPQYVDKGNATEPTSKIAVTAENANDIMAQINAMI